jgi:hypothetical protein
MGAISTSGPCHRRRRRMPGPTNSTTMPAGSPESSSSWAVKP